MQQKVLTPYSGGCEVQSQSLFSNLTPDELDLVDDNKVCMTFKKGDAVFTEGHYPLGLYCIDNGKIKIERSGDEGKKQVVRMVKSGEAIGYRALFCNEPYTASAVAIEDVSLFFVPKAIFFDLVKNNHKITQTIIKILAADLRKAEALITHLAQKPVRERMANTLIFLERKYGFAEDKATLNIQLSREELADMVGTATETTIRLLADFKHEGIVELSGKKIKLLNIDKLYRVAHLS